LVALHPMANINPYSVLEQIQNDNKLHIHKGALGQLRQRLLTVAGQESIELSREDTNLSFVAPTMYVLSKRGLNMQETWHSPITAPSIVRDQIFRIIT